jgi:hypothetical protein
MSPERTLNLIIYTVVALILIVFLLMLLGVIASPFWSTTQLSRHDRAVAPAGGRFVSLPVAERSGEAMRIGPADTSGSFRAIGHHHCPPTYANGIVRTPQHW